MKINYEQKYKEALERARKIEKGEPINVPNGTSIPVAIFPELKEKPNGGIVSENFNEGDGFYKVNLAYLSQEQVEEIENLVKKWNPENKESEDEKIRKQIKAFIKSRGSQITQSKTDAWLAWLEKQKHTWSEDDELMLKDVLEFIESGWSANGKSHLVYWLKSLRPQNRWTPSDKQGEQKPYVKVLLNDIELSIRELNNGTN